MNIMLIGFKGCGKTTIGKELAKRMNKKFIDVDEAIEEKHNLSCREIYKRQGAEFFRKTETEVLKEILKADNKIIAVGGGAVMKKDNRKLIKGNNLVIYIKLNKTQLYSQIIKNGIPAFFDKKNPKKSFEGLLKKREPVYTEMANIIIDTSGLSADKAVEKILKNIQNLD